MLTVASVSIGDSIAVTTPAPTRASLAARSKIRTRAVSARRPAELSGTPTRTGDDSARTDVPGLAHHGNCKLLFR